MSRRSRCSLDREETCTAPAARSSRRRRTCRSPCRTAHSDFHGRYSVELVRHALAGTRHQQDLAARRGIQVDVHERLAVELRCLLRRQRLAEQKRIQVGDAGERAFLDQPLHDRRRHVRHRERSFPATVFASTTPSDLPTCAVADGGGDDDRSGRGGTDTASSWSECSCLGGLWRTGWKRHNRGMTKSVDQAEQPHHDHRCRSERRRRFRVTTFRNRGQPAAAGSISSWKSRLPR